MKKVNVTKLNNVLIPLTPERTIQLVSEIKPGTFRNFSWIKEQFELDGDQVIIVENGKRLRCKIESRNVKRIQALPKTFSDVILTKNEDDTYEFELIKDYDYNNMPNQIEDFHYLININNENLIYLNKIKDTDSYIIPAPIIFNKGDEVSFYLDDKLITDIKPILKTNIEDAHLKRKNWADNNGKFIVKSATRRPWSFKHVDDSKVLLTDAATETKQYLQLFTYPVPEKDCIYEEIYVNGRLLNLEKDVKTLEKIEQHRKESKTKDTAVFSLPIDKILRVKDQR